MSARNSTGARVRRGFEGAALVSALLLSSGCMTSMGDWAKNGFKVGPNYETPPASVADNWIEANDPGVRDEMVDRWWRTFEDPKLDWLIDTACARNPSLHAVAMRVLQARAKLGIAGGNLFPQTQQVEGQYSRVNLSQNTFNNPSALSGAAPPGTPVPPLIGNDYGEWTAGFNLSWELDLWGRLRRSIESASAEVEASVGDYDAALVTLLADVATNYVRYRVAQQRIAIAQNNVRIQEEVLALAENRFNVGTTTRLDVEQARTILERTRSTIPTLRIELGEANDQLCVLLGEAPRDLESDLGQGTALGANPMAKAPTWVAAGIPADLLRRRPDIRVAERRLAAQSALIGVAEADLYPTLSVNGTLGWGASDLGKLFESKSFFGTITPGFRWNVLNYGRIENNVRLQQARADELVASYQYQVLNGAQEVQTSLRAFLRSREAADALGASVQAAVAATGLGVEQYKGGTIDFTPVFQLQTSQVDVQDQLALAQGSVALSLIGAYRALGGGWEIRLGVGSGETDADDPAVRP